MLPRRYPNAGFSLIEMMLVVALVAILAAIVLPSSQPAVVEQLRSTAQIVASDLAYARSLAVANDSSYRFTFDFANNRYVMKHSGTNAGLTRLPKSPFSSPGDPADQHIVDFDNLPHIGPTARLVAVTAGTSRQAVSDVEFGPLGQTTRTEPTTLWLAAGGRADQRYIAVEINPATGLTRVGECSTNGPPGAATGS